MRYKHLLLALMLGPFALAATGSEQDKSKGDDFVPLFNGKDLTGWANVNCAA